MSTGTRPDAGPPRVHIHYLRPPDHVEVFIQELVTEDAGAKVTFAREMPLGRTLRIDGEVALEDGSDVVWFTFPGAWHDIGRFHRADGTLTGIYANILVPCVFGPAGLWRTTDLFLDVWIPTPGGEWEGGPTSAVTVLDRAELDEAERNGWITPTIAGRARTEAEALVTGAKSGAWPPAVVGRWTRERIRGSRDP